MSSCLLDLLFHPHFSRSYDAIGPVMISACISFVCGEIVGPTNTILFIVALLLQAVGVISIAAGA